MMLLISTDSLRMILKLSFKKSRLPTCYFTGLKLTGLIVQSNHCESAFATNRLRTCLQIFRSMVIISVVEMYCQPHYYSLKVFQVAQQNFRKSLQYHRKVMRLSILVVLRKVWDSCKLSTTPTNCACQDITGADGRS